jgi:hypothetical protein
MHGHGRGVLTVGRDSGVSRVEATGPQRMHGLHKQVLRSCSFVLNWWVEMIFNRIVSLIYINFN